MQFGSAAKVLRKYNIGAPEIHSRGSLIHIAGCWSTYVLFGSPSMHILLDTHMSSGAFLCNLFQINIQLVFLFSPVLLIELYTNKYETIYIAINIIQKHIQIRKNMYNNAIFLLSNSIYKKNMLQYFIENERTVKK